VRNAAQKAKMKTISEIKKILAEQKPYWANKYGVIVLGVFGSYVRGEQTTESDLDILVDLERPPKISLIGLVELEEKLSEMLGTKVELVIRKNLKKRIGRHILDEVVAI